ncbi:MAG: hypothetical protein KF690_02310 [Bacteroidetes bacterium]|nr:hypothetical protein [Bacteroidota bacterium]
MQHLLQRLLFGTGWVFYLLSLGLYMLLVYAVYMRNYTFFEAAQGDMLVVFLGAALMLLLSILFTVMLKHRLHWLGLAILLVFGLSFIKAAIHIHRMPGPDTRWETPLKERLGTPRSNPALL